MTTVTIVRINNDDPGVLKRKYFLKINGFEMGQISEGNAKKFIEKYPHIKPQHGINMLPSFTSWHYRNP
tara:strand:+ start:80 stop:286 length:207 start_codon:yes stop_codon:yes gene_type:complete